MFTLNSSAERHDSRTSAAARSGPRPRSRATSARRSSSRSACATAALGAARDDEQVAVPRGELVELGEQLLPLGPTLDALDPLLGITRSQVETGDDRLLALLRHRSAQPDRIEKRAGRLRRLERLVEIGAAGSLDERGASLPHRRVDQAAGTIESSGCDARDRGCLCIADYGIACRQPLAHGGLREPPKRHELTPRANRLRDRSELVGDENDRRVLAGLLEILEQRVGSIRVESVRAEEQVDAAVGLERTEVKIVVELADRVDPDHLAERLDHAKIRV